MVDPIGSRNVRPVDRVVAAVPRAPAIRAAEGAAETPAMLQIARDMAAQPPVDVERVAEIRKAVADGTYPILPATIADHLLALKFNWVPDDKA